VVLVVCVLIGGWRRNREGEIRMEEGMVLDENGTEETEKLVEEIRAV